MKLQLSTAQQIVKRAMQVIPYSVNVMDENGIIIASGDPTRLQQHQVGAVLALRRNQAVEIDEKLAKQWQLRAGINFPITYLGQNVGVIGISGEPNTVRPYGELVKMAAELIIEANEQLAQERWQYRYKEEFLRQLLNGTLSPEQYQQQADFFQLHLEQPVVAILLTLLSSTQTTLQTLRNHLEQHCPQVANVVVDLDKVVLFYPLENSDTSPNKTQLATLLPSSLQWKAVLMVVGNPVRNLTQISRSYQTAQQTWQYAKQIRSQKHLLFFHDYRLPVLLTEFSQSWQGQTLLKFTEKLNEHDPHQQLQKSLSHYFLSNCDLDHAAKKLAIHPNTLRYRLNKIEQVLELSLNQIQDKFLLYLLALLKPNL